MAGLAPEGAQFDPRHYDSKMNDLLEVGAEEFFTSYDEVYDSFDAMGLSENLLRGIYAYGFEKPSAIQQRGIVPFTKGLDVIQQAQSGTGKTATFCSGVLQQLDYGVTQCQSLNESFLLGSSVATRLRSSARWPAVITRMNAHDRGRNT